MRIVNTGLAVSLPPSELSRGSFAGSVFTKESLASAPISEEIRLAIDLLAALCVERDVPLRFVARPEIYCEGDTLGWLMERLDGVEDHVSLSDGTAITVIPPLRNHVFFFGLNRQADQMALGRLASRVPEFIASLASQVNTAISFHASTHTVLLPSSLIHGRIPPTTGEYELYGFYLNRLSVEDSINRIALRGLIVFDALTALSKVTYVLLTEVSLTDREFMDILACLVARTFFEPDSGLIIRLAPHKIGDDAAEQQMRDALGALQHSQIAIPRLPASNIFFATADIGDDELSTFKDIDLIVHDSSDFWRHSPQFYAMFSAVRICFRPDHVHQRHFLKLLDDLLGCTSHAIPLGFSPQSQIAGF
jgi:hypothetical protein